MAKFRFKVLEGLHYEGTRCYAKGDVIDTDKDLSVFVNKFERIYAQVPVAPVQEAAPVAPVSVAVAAEDPEEGDAIPAGREFGEDVTSTFTKAASAGVLVFRGKDRKCTVVSEVEPTLALNDTPLTKVQTSEFIDKLIEQRGN